MPAPSEAIILVPPEMGRPAAQVVADYCRRQGLDASRAEEIESRAGCRRFRVSYGALLKTDANGSFPPA